MTQLFSDRARTCGATLSDIRRCLLHRARADATSRVGSCRDSPRAIPARYAHGAPRCGLARLLHSEVGSAARDLRLVEIVVRRRVHLVTLDLLADRVEADRMRDRDPRCFFLEDHLCLLVD